MIAGGFGKRPLTGQKRRLVEQLGGERVVLQLSSRHLNIPPIAPSITPVFETL